ncbi:hypothetical protein MACK_003880 [Theileria orientalis]|uniref:Uncharacterized protein n=1 Tax=Theileria orientalis TaxID=68886 RepID=A0A976XJD3_THEOR|nr:hypothetical protein MACK_003880 [Theileria orientalis]
MRQPAWHQVEQTLAKKRKKKPVLILMALLVDWHQVNHLMQVLYLSHPARQVKKTPVQKAVLQHQLMKFQHLVDPQVKGQALTQLKI